MKPQSLKVKTLMLTLTALMLLSYLPQPEAASASPPEALPEEYGPYTFEKYYYYIFWVPCSSAGDEGVVVRAVFPKEPRYPGGAPIAIYVCGGVKPGFLGFYDPDWDPKGMIWLNFIFPGGSQEVRVSASQVLSVKSGGEYDYRGDACLDALRAVIRFAQGEIRNGAGKLISDYADYPVLTDNIGLYGSSYGGVTAALTLARYGSELHGVKYIVFYESPPTSFLATTDLGRVGDDPDPETDGDGDGLPWNDYRNRQYVEGSCTETACTIDFSNLRYDSTVGFYLDNNGDGIPTYQGNLPNPSTDIDGDGVLEADEDFIFTPWRVVLGGELRKVYSRLVIEAAAERGLLERLPPQVMNVEETEDFWSWRELGPHYDDLAEKASWLRIMQLGFLKEHMCPSPDYPNIVVNYNGFKSRGFWVRLNPDKCYLEYVTGRKVEGSDNPANVELTFTNVRDLVLSDWKLNFGERKLIEQASMLEMADRVYYDCWDADLEMVLTEAFKAEVEEAAELVEEEEEEAKVVLPSVEEDVWVNIGPDGGDNYFIFVTSKHTVITATANSAFRSTDGGRTWTRISKPNLVDIGFTAMAEAEGVLFAGVGRGRGLMFSLDDGESWEPITTGLREIDGEEYYDIVSIVALDSRHLYLGLKTLKARELNEVYELVYEGSEGWKVYKHELPPGKPSAGKKVIRLAYDPDFKGLGPTLFVSKYPDGLYMATNLNGEWSWKKILDLETTAVDCAVENDIVYVGTYSDWIYRGEFDGENWSWVRLNPLEAAAQPLSLPGTPVISEVKVDPYNPDRFWWGSPGRLVGIYPLPEGHQAAFGVAAWSPEEGWLHSYARSGWGAFIAIDKHGEGEDEEAYKVYFNGVPGAKTAYTCSYSFLCVLKTDDGGKTWRQSYSGLYGDCVNEVSYLEGGKLPGTLVVLCQSGIELSYDHGGSWDDGLDVNPGGLRVCFPWCALPIPADVNLTIDVDGKTYEASFLLVTGFPGPEETPQRKRHGLLAVSTQYLREARSLGKPVYRGAKQLLDLPAVYGIIVEGRVVLALQEGGVAVYDLKTGETFTSSRGLPSSGGIYKIAHGRLNGVDWWLASTYEGEPLFKGSFGNDHYFWYGPSRIFRAKNLLENGGETVWEQVYPERGTTGRGVVSLCLSSSGEVLALEASGKLLYCPDISASKPEWKTLRLMPTSEGEPENFTDLEVAWEGGVAFISSVGWHGAGIYYVRLEDVRAAEGSVECYPYNEGLKTRLIRNILWVSDGGYLYAGSWWSSVWRVKPNLQKLSEKPKPAEEVVGEEEKPGGEQVKPGFEGREALAKADITGDGKVDIRDLMVLRKSYGARQGLPRFNPKADLNHDGRIDILDLAILASQYQKHV